MPAPVAQPASIPEHQADPWAHPKVVKTIASSGVAANLDVSAADVFDVTLTGNATLTIITPPSVGDVHNTTIKVTQDATHGRTCVIACKKADGTAGTIKWAGGAAPTFTAAASGNTDIVNAVTYDGGVTWLCNVAQNFA